MQILLFRGAQNRVIIKEECRHARDSTRYGGANMKIEHNPKELEAMKEFHKGNRAEGLKLQEEFAAEFRKEYADKDHCPCKKACRYHGNCKECVAIHRAHQEHVPNCMREMLNRKIRMLSELTEHSIASEIEPPREVLRKEFQTISD